jgi:hypothetical protein
MTLSDLLEQPCNKSDNSINLVTSCYSASTVSGGHLENTNQSHCKTKIEKINKRRISQSALGQKQFEQINECQTVKIDL